MARLLRRSLERLFRLHSDDSVMTGLWKERMQMQSSNLICVEADCVSVS